MAAPIKGSEFSGFLGALSSLKAAAASAEQPVAPDTVLEILASQRRPISVIQILKDTPITLSTLASTLETLKTANLVKSETIGNEELVSLTEMGRQIAQLAVKK